ncbi:MAG TPA: polyphosphate kinase 2, partial [Aquabacterium sp.]|nr:polyphosphate kinase 2 [Aquabacterium sp.]
MADKTPSSRATRPPRTPAQRRSTPLRRASAGDISPTHTPSGLAHFVAHQATEARQEAQVAALQDIVGRTRPEELARVIATVLQGTAPDDAAVLRQALRGTLQDTALRIDPDEALAPHWRDAASYPYQNLMARKSYEKQKYRLQVELLKLQAWVKATGQKVVILFEGRDAAGKGGAIKRFME